MKRLKNIIFQLRTMGWAQRVLELFILVGGFIVILSYIWLIAVCSGKA